MGTVLPKQQMIAHMVAIDKTAAAMASPAFLVAKSFMESLVCTKKMNAAVIDSCTDRME
jgi:hypothetical protein